MMRKKSLSLVQMRTLSRMKRIGDDHVKKLVTQRARFDVFRVHTAAFTETEGEATDSENSIIYTSGSTGN